MIDPQHAGVAHVGAVQRAEGGPAARARRRADSAPAGSSSVPGRRTDRAARRSVTPRASSCCVRPRLPRRPAPRRPRDRDRSQSRAPPARALGGPPEAGGRRAIGRRGRTRRPDGSARSPCRSLWVRRRAESCGQTRQFAPASPSAIAWKAAKRRRASPPDLDEGIVVGDERIAWARAADAGEGLAPGFERGSLGAPDGVVLDTLGRGRGGECRRQRGERRVDRLVARQPGAVESVDEYRIEEAPIGGMIGAGALPVAREQHMQRADAEIGRPGAASRLARAARASRSRRCPGRPVLRCAPERVELGGDAEPLALRRRSELIGLRRGDRQRAFDAVDDEPVAADRQRRQRDRALGDACARRAGRGGRRRRPRRAIRRRPRPPASMRASTARGRSRKGATVRLVEAQHERKGQAARRVSSTSRSGCRAPRPRCRPRGRARREGRSWSRA